MKTTVYFARKDNMGLIAYENKQKQNVFLQIDNWEYAPQIVNTVICDASQYKLEGVITHCFEYQIEKKEKIDIGWKYKHIWKPLMNVNIQKELDFSLVDLCHAKRDLGILIQKLQEILLYVEPSSEGLKAYSHKIRELLILSCTDLESTFKKYKLGKNDKMSDYVKILNYVDLTKYHIGLVGYANPFKCCPFENWNKGKETKSLPWYDAYNQIKHNRDENFPLATLENCINAISANLIMFAVRYAPMTLYNENDVCSNLARSSLSYTIEHSNDLYIPIIEGQRNYRDTSFQFRNGNVIYGTYDIAQTIPFEEREVK